MGKLSCFHIAAFVWAASAVSGCEVAPRDSHGALERIEQAGELRVGIAYDPPWTAPGAGGAAGIEPAILQRFAAERGLRVRYVPGSEADLVEALHRREIDVLAAGLSRKTPHASRIALTQAYYKADKQTLRATAEPESEKQRALAVIPGESRLLHTLDRFLLERRPEWRALIEAEARGAKGTR
jgi:polar amino acid transport system substrate-binding protein